MFKGANLYGATAIFLIVSQQYIKLTGLLILLKIRSIDFHACQIDLQHFIAAEAAKPHPKALFFESGYAPYCLSFTYRLRFYSLEVNSLI